MPRCFGSTAWTHKKWESVYVRISVWNCVCKLICSSTQSCIRVFVHFILNVLWTNGSLLKPLLVWFIQLIAVGFQSPDQAAEMQSVVKLDCNKLNVIQLRKIAFPSSFSYLLRYALDFAELLGETCVVDVHPTWINGKFLTQRGKNALFILEDTLVCIISENSHKATHKGLKVTSLL